MHVYRSTGQRLIRWLYRPYWSISLCILSSVSPRDQPDHHRCITAYSSVLKQTHLWSSSSPHFCLPVSLSLCHTHILITRRCGYECFCMCAWQISFCSTLYGNLKPVQKYVGKLHLSSQPAGPHQTTTSWSEYLIMYSFDPWSHAHIYVLGAFERYRYCKEKFLPGISLCPSRPEGIGCSRPVFPAHLDAYWGDAHEQRQRRFYI